MTTFSSSSFRPLKGHLWIKTSRILKLSQVSEWREFLKVTSGPILISSNPFMMVFFAIVYRSNFNRLDDKHFFSLLIVLFEPFKSIYVGKYREHQVFGELYSAQSDIFNV